MIRLSRFLSTFTFNRDTVRVLRRTALNPLGTRRRTQDGGTATGEIGVYGEAVAEEYGCRCSSQEAQGESPGVYRHIIFFVGLTHGTVFQDLHDKLKNLEQDGTDLKSLNAVSKELINNTLLLHKEYVVLTMRGVSGVLTPHWKLVAKESRRMSLVAWWTFSDYTLRMHHILLLKSR